MTVLCTPGSLTPGGEGSWEGRGSGRLHRGLGEAAGGGLGEELLDGGFEEQQGPGSEERGLRQGRGVQAAGWWGCGPCLLAGAATVVRCALR